MAEYIGLKNDFAPQLTVSDGSFTETRIFRSDPRLTLYEQVEDVLGSGDYVPVPGRDFHPFFKYFACTKVVPERDPKSSEIWYLHCDWSVGQGGSLDFGKSQQPQWGDPPESWLPTLGYNTEFRYVNSDAARANLRPVGVLGLSTGHILKGDSSELFYLPVNLAMTHLTGHFTAAGEVYTNPGIQVREQIDSIEITRYEREFFFNDKKVKYPHYRYQILGKVNSSRWHGFPPRTVLLDSVTARTVWYGGTAYNQVTYVFKVDLNFVGRGIYNSEDDQSYNPGGLSMTSSHDPIVLHAGFKEVDQNKEVKRILDSQSNSLPTPTPLAPLSGWPALLKDGGAVQGYFLRRGQSYPHDTWGKGVAEGLTYLFPFIAYREKQQFDFYQLGFHLGKFFPTLFED